MASTVIQWKVEKSTLQLFQTQLQVPFLAPVELRSQKFSLPPPPNGKAKDTHDHRRTKTNEWASGQKMAARRGFLSFFRPRAFSSPTTALPLLTPPNDRWIWTWTLHQDTYFSNDYVYTIRFMGWFVWAALDGWWWSLDTIGYRRDIFQGAL